MVCTWVMRGLVGLMDLVDKMKGVEFVHPSAYNPPP
jgi:hypothetical protein